MSDFRADPEALCNHSGQVMAQIQPWYSIRQRDGKVYHDNNECPIGNAIEVKYRKPGHRCRVRCSTCAKLAAALENPEHLARLTPL